MTSSTKGDRVERELVNMLDEAGYAVMRAPSSGSATTRELPDVLALQNEGEYSRAYAIEVKARKGWYVSLSENEITALRAFSESAGALPLIALRPNREAFSFHTIDLLNRTPKGNYSVTQDMKGMTFEELVG